MLLPLEPLPIDAFGRLGDDAPPLDRPPILWEIKGDGEHVYRKSDPADALSAKLQRVWAERGDFSKLTLESINAAAAESADAEAAEQPPQEEDEQPTSLTAEQMWSLRRDMLMQLETAKNEFGITLDLLNLLTSSLDNAPAPPPGAGTVEGALPAGSLATTRLSHLPARPSAVQLREQTLIYASKQAALKSTQKLFFDAARGIGKTVQRSQAEWQEAVKLREKGWTMQARGARQGAGMKGKALERTAKEVVVFYGFEEAEETLRRRSIALLDASGDDGCSVDMPFRSRKRLRLTVEYPTTSEKSSIAINTTPTSASDIADQLEAARQEVLDEQLFNEILKEARDAPALNAKIGKDAFKIEASSDVLITFELAPSDISATNRTAEDEADPAAKLIMATLRLLLMRHYSDRRRNTSTYNTSKQNLGTSTATLTGSEQVQTNLITPVIDFIGYYCRATRVKAILEGCAVSLTRVGFRTGVRWEPVELGVDGLLDAIGGGSKSIVAGGHLELGGSAALDIDAMPSLHVTMSSTGSSFLHLTLAHFVLPVPAISQFPSFLNLEVRRLLSQHIVERGNEEDSVQSKWHWAFDEITGLVTGEAKASVKLPNVALDLAFDEANRLAATFRRIGQAEEVYESSKQGLLEWLDASLQLVLEHAKMK